MTRLVDLFLKLLIDNHREAKRVSLDIIGLDVLLKPLNELLLDETLCFNG